MTLPRIGLVTFGAGLPNWRAAARRLGHQAAESGRFEKISVNTDHSMSTEHKEFFEKHATVLRPAVRGFGYWIWKPYLIEKALQEWGNEVDCIAYLDGGCEINSSPESQNRWEEYLHFTMQGKGRLVMQLTQYPEHEWSKGDTLDALGLDADNRLSGQIQTAPSFFRSDSANQDFTHEWLDMCVVDNYHLVDDTPSHLPNSPTFQDHRHDQAILSGLIKKYGAHVIPDETYWAPNWEETGKTFPIWAMRNRSGVSVLDQSLNGKIVRFSERLYSKIYRDVRIKAHSRKLSRG
jgi:hypothetical protein